MSFSKAALAGGLSIEIVWQHVSFDLLDSCDYSSRF